tara:strand:+ start:405 stop:566 length:162 start_codon:yes stop_codon:yes gene_type:complete
MNKYEIMYRHSDMNPDYMGLVHKWARDEKAAKDLMKKKPYIKIVSIREVPRTS